MHTQCNCEYGKKFVWWQIVVATWNALKPKSSSLCAFVVLSFHRSVRLFVSIHSISNVAYNHNDTLHFLITVLLFLWQFFFYSDLLFVLCCCRRSRFFLSLFFFFLFALVRVCASVALNCVRVPSVFLFTAGKTLCMANIVYLFFFHHLYALHSHVHFYFISLSPRYHSNFFFLLSAGIVLYMCLQCTAFCASLLSSPVVRVNSLKINDNCNYTRFSWL